VPAEPVILFNETEPGFVMSLDRVGDRGYVMGGASGWQTLQAGLWVLAPDTLAPRHEVRLDAEMVWARYDPTPDRVVALSEQDNQVSLRRFQLEAGQGPVETVQAFACLDCVPAASSPVVRDGLAAVAVRNFGDDTVQAFFWADGAPAVTESLAVPGDTPHLLPGASGPTLYFAREGGLWQLPLDWQGGWIADPSPVHPEGLREVLTAEPGASSRDWLVLMAEGTTPDEPVVWLWQRAGGGSFSELARLPGLLPYALQVSVSESLGTVALAWGVTFGAGEVGPHLVILDAQSGALSLEPQLMDHPINHSSSSHTIWAAAAPHPEGHAVVWGGWRESTHNGIYGKIIRRAPAR
jgi:hypothetical protein